MTVLGIGVWCLSSDVSVFLLFIMGVASVFGFGYPLVFLCLQIPHEQVHGPCRVENGSRRASAMSFFPTIGRYEGHGDWAECTIVVYMLFNQKTCWE